MLRMRNGTSKSLKSTRQRGNLLCPGRPAVDARLDKKCRVQHRPQMTLRRVGCPYRSSQPAKEKTPPPLRKSARTHSYRGLPAFASLSLTGSGRTSSPAASSLSMGHARLPELHQVFTIDESKEVLRCLPDYISSKTSKNIQSFLNQRFDVVMLASYLYSTPRFDERRTSGE